MFTRARNWILGQVAVTAAVSTLGLAGAAPASACINNPMFPAGIAGNCPTDIDGLPQGAEEAAAKFNQQAIDAQNGVLPGQIPPAGQLPPPPPPPPRLPQATVCLPIPFVPCFPVGG
jgi:hypothetical protein